MTNQISSLKKFAHIIIGGTIGNIAEWYNFLLYGYLASSISQLFFPVQNKLLSLVFTFAVFALSFLVRPLGGIIFGWIGDTYGRQKALLISLAMMGVPTLFIGCLPTYQNIGIISPILLCVLRVCQGLSAGGEHTGAAVYLAEHAPAKFRSLWVSTVPASAALGVLMSSMIALLMASYFTHEQLLAWGWRTGFWLGALLCFISFLFRISMPETPYYKKVLQEKSSAPPPISTLIRDPQTRKNLFIVFTLASSWAVFYQILFIWMPTFLTHVEFFSNSVALQINTIYMILFSCLILCVGYLGCHVNHKFLLFAACVAMLFCPYPLFILLTSGSLGKIYLAMAIFTFIFSLYIPIAFVHMVEMFKPQVRYTGLSLSFNASLAIFGGTAPLIATELIEITKISVAPAFYMMCVVIISLVAIIWKPRIMSSHMGA